MWKLYISGNPESGYECLLKTSIETIPLSQFPSIRDDSVTMLGIDNKIYISTPGEIEIIRQDGAETSEVKPPSSTSISVAALITDLNHIEFPHTPNGQKFSYETHKQIGGRKLNHERD